MALVNDSKIYDVKPLKKQRIEASDPSLNAYKRQTIAMSNLNEEENARSSRDDIFIKKVSKYELFIILYIVQNKDFKLDNSIRDAIKHPYSTIYEFECANLSIEEPIVKFRDLKRH